MSLLFYYTYIQSKYTLFSTTYSLQKEVFQNLLSIFDLKTLHSTLVQTRVLQKRLSTWLSYTYFFQHTVILSDRTLKIGTSPVFAFQFF